MDEQGYKFGVGVLVIASLVIAIILVLFFGAAPNLFAKRYTVTIEFDSAPGVTTDTPVRKAGVQIGRVQSVKLQDEGGVNLTLELDSEFRVRAGDQPRIGTGSLITGDAVVEFVPVPNDSPRLLARFDGINGAKDGFLDQEEKLAANSYIQDGEYYKGGTVAPNPLDAFVDIESSMSETLGTFQSAGNAITTAGNQVTQLASDVQRIIGGGDGEFKRIAQQAELTIDNLNRTLNTIDGVFSDPNIKNTIATISDRLPALVDNAENAINQVGDTVAAFEKTAQAFEEVGVTAEATIGDVADSLSGVSKTIDNINAFTDPLADQSEEIVGEVRQTLRDLDRFLVDLRGVSAQVKQVATRINNGQGTVAKLIDDPQLYYRLDSALMNVETLTRRLLPIVEDTRVLSDKLARDPSTIVRGAIFGPRGGGIK
ncbi:MAG: MlaD family protein [Aureliella sp.]